MGRVRVRSAALAAPEDFPKPAALDARVSFWKRVYSEVGTDAGFLHDPDDLSLVYEKVSLPTGRWDRVSQRHVDARKRHVAQLLRNLSRGKRSELTHDEQRVLALFPAGAGSRTLRGKAEAVRFQLGQADKFRAGLARQGRWDAHIRQVLAERGVPPELGALPHVESSFNPEAHSHVGASGIWQFMRSTGRLYMRVDDVRRRAQRPVSLDGRRRAPARSRTTTRSARGRSRSPATTTASAACIARCAQLGTRDIGVDHRALPQPLVRLRLEELLRSVPRRARDRPRAGAYFGVVRRDPPDDPERVILDHYYRPPTLAAAFGVSVDALRAVNPAVTDAVWAGRRLLPKGYELRVPRDPLRAAPRVVLASIAVGDRSEAQVQESSGTHRVRRGETLSRIAAKYGVSTRELQRANGLRSANRIRVGQRLEIPGYSPPPVQMASASAPPEPAPAEGVYRVRRGDTLASIARRFGVSARDLATVNRIRDANSIHPGQVIELPGGSLTARPEDRSHAGTYTVRSGDTLDAIARKFGVGVSELIAHNGIRNKHRIRVGQSIYIPGPPEPPTAPVSAAAQVAVQGAAPATADAAPSAPLAISVDGEPATAYVVRRGDTLEKIAATTGVSQDELVALNAIRNKHQLDVGQALKLSASAPEGAETAVVAAAADPSPTPTEYVVRRGDTLEKIAAATGVAQSELVTLNGIRNKNRIGVGQTLKLPAAPPPASGPDTAPQPVEPASPQVRVPAPEPSASPPPSVESAPLPGGPSVSY